jgi:hypothetical protein
MKHARHLRQPGEFARNLLVLGVETHPREVSDIGAAMSASLVLLGERLGLYKTLARGGPMTPADLARRTGTSAVARERAMDAGLSDNIRFEVGQAQDYPGTYDFVTTFDCLHDMSDPLGAVRHTRQTLAPDGSWMIVEPMAADDVAHNLNPIGRVFYAASTMFCVPSSLHGHGPALGAQAGEKKIREVVTHGGFSQVHRAAQTPFNLMLEARP